MTILDQINAYKKKEVASKKEAFPITILEQSLYFNRTSYSLAEAIKNSTTGIIAEHKRKSPSKAVINDQIKLPEVVKGYEDAGAIGISILTNTKFFGGSLDDLLLARNTVQSPLLRKEFIIDEYQILEAKAYGADAILLIAASLSKKKIKDFSIIAKQLSLDVLVEIHHEAELEKSVHETVDIIGVNNRNLKTFEVSLENSLVLAQKIPSSFVKISESGLKTPEDIQLLREVGFQGFLMGEQFMKAENPGKSLKEFILNLS